MITCVLTTVHNLVPAYKSVLDVFFLFLGKHRRANCRQQRWLLPNDGGGFFFVNVL